MKIDGWKYYNHAAITTTPAHMPVDPAPVVNGEIWKLDGSPLLARWTEDFDCKQQTNWWYVIADTPLDISKLKAKRRYVINKGDQNFQVKVIDPALHREELYRVQVAAFAAYPEKYRPTQDKETFFRSLEKEAGQGDGGKLFGAFYRQTGELCGYARVRFNGGCAELPVLKTKPAFEKHQVNAALVYGIMKELEPFLIAGGYIVDGARSIHHESAFQDYLEKYFSFRKAYCKLCVCYRPGIRAVVKLLYPFRKLLLKLDSVGLIHQVNGVLKMEEIVRNAEQ